MQEEAKESNLKADSDVRVTRKTKVSARATLSRNTRRNKKVDSSDEVILPQIIPRSQSLQLMVFQAFQIEETRLILQVPIGRLVEEPCVLKTWTRVENLPIEIIINKDNAQNFNLEIKEKLFEDTHVINGNNGHSVLGNQQTQIPNQSSERQNESSHIHNESNHILSQHNEIQNEHNQRVNGHSLIQSNGKQDNVIDLIDSGESNHSQQEGSEVTSICLVWGKYSWLSGNEVETKLIKSCRREIGKNTSADVASFRIKDAESDLFVSLSIKKQQQLCTAYQGLINQGNTCYMNSYLQMLYHIGEFRRLVFEARIKDETKFPATLQMLFYDLFHEDRAVSSEQLVRSFGWTKKDVQIQQDAQEFSCKFFEVLEDKLREACPESKHMSINELFEGELTHYIQCVEVCTSLIMSDFRTENSERFFDLQLGLSSDLATSLDEYVSEQLLSGDNMYRTEEHGLQKAVKGVRLSRLPPVLMIQLKRFQFNPYTESNEKLLSEFRYPEKINFGKWMMSEKQQLPDDQCEFELYGVLVHEGLHASSGHYYAYLLLDGRWLKFNDETVWEATKEQAFKHNFGGSVSTIEYNSRNMTVEGKDMQNRATAYMLVYQSKAMKNKLMDRHIDYPEWLLESNANQLKVEEEKRLRKGSICDVRYLSWREDILGRTCSLGFVTKELLEQSNHTLGLINRGRNLEEWITEFIKGHQQETTVTMTRQQDKSGSHSRKDRKLGVYLHYCSNEREVVQCTQAKRCATVGDFFNKDIPDPLLLLCPFWITRNQYLIVIKLYSPDESRGFSYDRITKIRKDARLSDLHNELMTFYQREDVYHRFYLEDARKGLILISPTESLVPNALPSRNQLLIVIVERLRIDLAEDEHRKNHGIEKWYQRERSMATIVFRNQVTKEVYERELNEDMTVEDLRVFIFKEILNSDEEYISAQNIVIRSRMRRNGKIFGECHSSESLKSIIKHDNTLHFGFSTLDASQRLSLREIVFYYRTRELVYSEGITIVVDKHELQLIFFIHQHPKVIEKARMEGYYATRLMLMSKDRSSINDIIDQKGYVLGKGDLYSVLAKEKNAVLVVEGDPVCLGEQQGLGRGDDERPKAIANILVHHITKTTQKIGSPRWVSVDAATKILDLKCLLLQVLKNDGLQWEGKTYGINPMKAKLWIYTKDVRNSFELLDREENRLQKEQMTEENGEQCLQKQEDVEDGIQENEVASKEDEKVKQQDPPIEEKGNGEDQEKVCAQGYEKQQNTIGSYFGTVKYLRVVVMHMGLAKGVHALRLNVE